MTPETPSYEPLSMLIIQVSMYPLHTWNFSEQADQKNVDCGQTIVLWTAYLRSTERMVKSESSPVRKSLKVSATDQNLDSTHLLKPFSRFRRAESSDAINPEQS